MTTKSVILVDFDNVFTALWERDPDVADLFGRKCGEWLSLLARELLVADQRRWLVARCYLSPDGCVWAREKGDKLFFRKYRPDLIRAGFEIVDCPKIAGGGKNAADIKMVIDALDLLARPTIYDEFVIASGDSDFAPLLQRLRAFDRLTTIVAPKRASEAYTSVADRVINYADLVSLLPKPPVRPSAIPVGAQPEPVDDDSRPADDFVGFIRSRYAESDTPINLAQLSSAARRVLPEGADDNWRGPGKFKPAIVALDLPGATFSKDFLWDAMRHASPAGETSKLDRATVEPPPKAPIALRDVEGTAETLKAIVELASAESLPSMSSDQWHILLDAIATREPQTEAGASAELVAIRDRLKESAAPVGRRAIGAVWNILRRDGDTLLRRPPASTDDLVTAVYRRLLEDRSDVVAAELPIAGLAVDGDISGEADGADEAVDEHADQIGSAAPLRYPCDTAAMEVQEAAPSN